jgi:hypothetical protein
MERLLTKTEKFNRELDYVGTLMAITFAQKFIPQFNTK